MKGSKVNAGRTANYLHSFHIAIDHFVNEMNAIRELLQVAAPSAIGLDDRDKIFASELAELLPRATPLQINDVKSRWPSIIADIPALSRDRSLDGAAEGSAEDEEELRQKSVEAMKRGEREISNLLGMPGSFWMVFRAWNESIGRPRREPLMRSALLTTAVSSFEVLIAQIVRYFFIGRPEALRASETKYTLVEIEGFASLDEFRMYCIDRQVDSLMFGGFDDWMTWFNRQMKLDWTSLIKEPILLQEVFQRRHLLVHNGGIVNRQYLLKLQGSENLPEIGTQLAVDEAYCDSAIDLLILAGVLIGVRAIRKIETSGPKPGRVADNFANTISYEFLRSGRDHLVIKIIDSEVALCVDDEICQLMRVNRWIAQKNLYGLDHIIDEVKVWQTSPLAKKYHLAKLALLERYEEALDLGLELRASGEISPDNWLLWPILNGVREREANRTQGIDTPESDG